MQPTLVILAAGLASRYGGAKQLAPVGPAGETIVDYNIYDAWRAGFGRVVLVVGPESERALREHVVWCFGPAAPVRYAVQRLGDLPAGYRVPAGRRAPWGTGHALLAAAPELDQPFAVCNADDLYGASSFALLAEHCAAHSGAVPPVFALVGCRLAATLSAAGGVSRGVCEVDEAGWLRRVVEVRDIGQEGSHITGVLPDGRRQTFTGGELISPTLWGFTPALLPALRSSLVAFLERDGADLEAEFLLGHAVNKQLARGEARVRVLGSSAPWLGITYRADRVRVARAVRELVRAGAYPAELRHSFRKASLDARGEGR